MANYIDRDAAREEFNRRGLYGTELFDMFPVADVAPVLHGKWVEHKVRYKGERVSIYMCSECDTSPTANIRKAYCCNCGAKMDLE